MMLVFIFLLHYCKSVPKDRTCLSQVARLGMPHVSQKWESFLRLKRVSSTNSSSHPATRTLWIKPSVQRGIQQKKGENLTEALSIVLSFIWGKQALCIHFVSMTCVSVYYTCPFLVVYINFSLEMAQTDANVILIEVNYLVVYSGLKYKFSEMHPPKPLL